MHYIITGGSGFIGTNLRQLLHSKGDTYTTVDKVVESPFSVKTDVVDNMPSVNGDCLVHLASETNIRASLSHPNRYIKRNIIGLLNVLARAREDRIEDVVFTSSASADLAESPYLASKAACEKICDAYFKSFGLPVRILKLSSVYGPHSIHKQSVVHQFIKAALRKEPLVIFGNGKQFRDFVYVEDVCKAIVREYCGYVTTGTLTTINELAERIADLSETLTGFRPKIKYESPFIGEVLVGRTQMNSLPNPKSLAEGLLTTFNWYKDNYGY
jgi:UDP-glucose 4-epimerase